MSDISIIRFPATDYCMIFKDSLFLSDIFHSI